MKISKDQIVQLLESQGNHDKAQQASQQLPDQVDTDNGQHADLLSKLGLDTGNLGNQLGGLGKILLPLGGGRGSCRAGLGPTVVLSCHRGIWLHWRPASPRAARRGYPVRRIARDPGKLSDRLWSGDVETPVAWDAGARDSSQRMLPRPLGPSARPPLRFPDGGQAG